MPTPIEDRNAYMDEYLAQFMKEKKARELRQRQILKQISQLYPEEKFRYFNRGSSAMLFRSRSHPELIYKYYLMDSPRTHETQEDYLSRIKKYASEEVAMLVFLNSHGAWTPKVDLERTRLDIDHPTVVMEYIKTEHVAVAPVESRQQAYEELTELLSTHGVSVGDVEPVYDTRNKRIRIIDAGGFSAQSGTPLSQEEIAELKEKNRHRLNTIA